MKTRLLTTTVLALGLMFPAAAMAQNASSGSSESNKPTMNSPAPSGSSATGSSSMGTGSTGTGSTGAGTTSSGTTSDSTTGTSGSTTSGTTGTTTGTSGATTMSALDKTIVGKTLYGANEEEVGEIDDVVMSQSGEVESVLIDVGGFLGLGAKTIAVPADDISMQGDKVVASTLTKDQAEQMPEYKKN